MSITERRGRTLIKIFKAILVAAALGAMSGCTHLIYRPTDLMYPPKPEVLDHFREEVSFQSGDGTKLAGWYFPSKVKNKKGALIQFHGNGQNMTAHFASLFWVIEEGYDLFTFDYRGYGISEGKPSQEGLNQDSLAAIRYVMKRLPSAAEPNIVLYGQSLGGAVLMRAYDDVSPEERKRVRAMVIEGSFHNYHEIARSALSRSWLTFLFQPLGYVLISNAYGPGDAIERISPTPLLVIHGDHDRVVPHSFGEKIFEQARQPKKFLTVEGGGHIDSMVIQNGRYRRELMKFLDDPRG